MTFPNSPSEVDRVIESQRSWAMRNGLRLNADKTGFAETTGGLVREELYPETQLELDKGAGGELNRIHSLRSSTALSLNVFEPWRPNPSPLGSVFGCKAHDLSFEARQPTGLGGVSPHLDVLITGSGPTVGIEAKFLEMYSPKAGTFADSYFSDPELWEDLTQSRRLALRIENEEDRFRWLQADQLLKHALGLRKNQPDGFRLVLVWYRVEGEIVEQIEEEVGRFARAVSSDFDFSAMTYQELVTDLARLPEPVPGYLDYLADRYQLEPGSRLELPLIAIGNQPAVNRRRNLDGSVRDFSGTDLRKAFHQTVGSAPQRPLVGKRFLVGHTGGGDMSDMKSERVVAKAVFNSRTPIRIGDRSVSVLDYEVPLRSSQADGGVGEIDLLGVDEIPRRLSVIELKVAPNSDTPLKALFQALRYSAIVDANRHAIAEEIEREFGLSGLSWPASITVAADRPYWQRLRDTPEAGDWHGALESLAVSINSVLGIETYFVDLGDLVVEQVDGAAQLASSLISHAL